MKKQILGLIALLSLSLISQCSAQDSVLKPAPCECKVDTIAIIQAYLKSQDYYLSTFTNDRGAKVRIKQKHLYLGGGYGKNTFKCISIDEKGHYQPVNRNLYYARASFSDTWFNFGLNIGNSIVSADFSYILR